MNKKERKVPEFQVIAPEKTNAVFFENSAPVTKMFSLNPFKKDSFI